MRYPEFGLSLCISANKTIEADDAHGLWFKSAQVAYQPDADRRF